MKLNKAIATWLVALNTLTPSAKGMTPDSVTTDSQWRIAEVLVPDLMGKVENNGQVLQYEEAEAQCKDDLVEVLQNEEAIQNSEEKEDDKKSKKSVKFGWSAELQTTLYNPVTFLTLSERPWAHLQGSATLPLGEKTSVTLSEDLYATADKNNLTSENNFTDMLLSYNINDQVSVTGWVELFQFLKQDRGTDLFSTFWVVNYRPNEKFNFNTLVFKPICSLDWQKNPNLFISNTATYTTTSNKEFLLRLWTNCTNNWNTQASFGFRAPIWDKSSVEFTTIPNETWIVPWWVQWCLNIHF